MKKLILIIMILITLSSCIPNNKQQNIKYEITFDNCGFGTEVNSISNVNKLPEELPILFDDEYKFIGWYLDSNYTLIAEEDTTINSSITLYAKWEKLVITEGLDFVLSSTGLDYVLYGFTDNSVKDVVIPSEYNDKPVKYIGAGAFMGDNEIESVMIPSSVEIIDEHAFSSCENLKYISVGKGVKEIDKYAFCNLPTLQKIVVDSNNLTFDSRKNCNAIIEKSSDTLVVGCNGTIIPNSVTTIAKYAFYGSGITNITIPKSVFTICESAFNNCTNLTTIVILENLCTINDFAFVKCEKLKTIFNNSNLKLTVGDDNNGKIAFYAEQIYNKGEWSYINGIPTPNKQN